MPTPRYSSVVINHKAARNLRPRRIATPEQIARVIALKIAGQCAAQIVEDTGVPEHKITHIWRDYRDANPSQVVMPKNHNTRRGDWK
jgi:hypothetical protein